MDQFLQHVLNGVVLGGTYALLGIGLTLIFGIMRVVNFTHGELYAFGAYLTYLFVALLHGQLLRLDRARGRWRAARSAPPSSSCCCARSSGPTSTPPCW